MWPYVLSLMQRVMSYCESVVPNVCTWFGSDLAGSVCWISGRQTQWMKNQREPSAGKGAMRGHGETAQPCASAAWAVCRHSLDYCGICFILREVLKEDESGSLKATVEEILYQSKRKRCACLCLSVCLSVYPSHDENACVFSCSSSHAFFAAQGDREPWASEAWNGELCRALCFPHA